MPDQTDERFLRRAIEVARRARENGNQPFGAVLVDPDGNVVLEAENSVETEHDATAHAERNLMSLASRRFEKDFLAGCTMYTSAEPCAMCAGAAYWANVRRIVYALDLPGLDAVVGADPANPTPHLRANVVLAGGKYPVALDGPALTEEAKAVHDGYWR